ncbi:MAG: CBS domain-containing protein [Candidatus Bathyarchaeota archaeon]|nr:CBS domain-containing protein [Candidatus Bathyarchaeota archaeon]
MASTIKVNEIMTKDIPTVGNETTVAEVVKLMAEKDLGYIMVEMQGKPTGIITEHDVIVRLVTQDIPPKSVIARMVYTNPIFTIDQNATVQEAVNMMKYWGVKHLPVTGAQGELVGVVTAENIIFAVPAMLKELEELYKPGYKRVR